MTDALRWPKSGIRELKRDFDRYGASAIVVADR